MNDDRDRVVEFLDEFFLEAAPSSFGAGATWSGSHSGLLHGDFALSDARGSLHLQVNAARVVDLTASAWRRGAARDGANRKCRGGAFASNPPAVPSCRKNGCVV